MRKLGILILTAVCLPALAETTYRADVGVGYSNNIRRVPTNQESETIGTAGLDFNWLENTRRLDANVAASGAYLHYLDDTFDDEVVGTANGDVTIGIVPERFTWLLQDSFGQAQSDPFAPATPETRENINYFTTGPDFVASLGDANSMRFFGRYSKTTYEESLLDSDRIAGGLIVARQLARQSRIALQGTEEQTRFDDLTAADYDRRNVFLTYDATGARTTLLIDAGYTWTTRQDDAEIAGPLVRVDIGRELSAATRLTLSAGTQISDASQALRGSVEVAPQGTAGSVTSSPDLFENRFASLGWNYQRNRSSFGLRAAWNEDRYDAVTQLQSQPDRTQWVYEATTSRRFTPTLTTHIVGTFTEQEFAAGRTSEEIRVVGVLDWQFGRHVGLSFRAERHHRETSDHTFDYRETRGFVTLFYRGGEAAVR